MPITVTGARALVAGRWTHAGLHTTSIPGQSGAGQSTELTDATARGYARQPVVMITETTPEARIVPQDDLVFGVATPQDQWPRVRSVAFYNGDGADADLLAWQSFAQARLPDDNPQDSALTLDRSLLDVLLMDDFSASGFTDAGKSLLYGGRVFRGHFALHTAAPTATNELDGAGYARIDATGLLGLDPDIGDVAVRNNAIVQWEPAGTWDAPTHLALWSESAPGEGVLWWSAEIPEPGGGAARTVPTETQLYGFEVGEILFDFGLTHRVGFLSAPDRRLNDALLGPARTEAHDEAPTRYAVARALEQVVVSSGLTEGTLEGLLYRLIDTDEGDIRDPEPTLLHPITLFRYRATNPAQRRYHGMNISGLQMRWGFLQVTPDPDPDYILFDPPFSTRAHIVMLQQGGYFDDTLTPIPTFYGGTGQGGKDTRVIIGNDRHRVAVYSESTTGEHYLWLAIGH